MVADHIVAVHNGVLTNDDALVRLAERDRVGEVDSWAIAGLLANMESLGASHPSDVLDLVQGRAAIAWLDADDPKALWLACLHGSPMTIGWTRKGDLVMSSTRQTMRTLERVAKVTIRDLIDVPEGAILRVVGGHIVEWTGTPKPVRQPPVKRTPKQQPRAKIRDLIGVPADALIHDVPPIHGVTDWFDRRGIPNFDDAATWPSGVEQIEAKRERERREAIRHEVAFERAERRARDRDRNQNGSRRGR